MLWRSRLRNRLRCYNAGGGPVQGALLVETGDFLLLENGSYILL